MDSDLELWQVIWTSSTDVWGKKKSLFAFIIDYGSRTPVFLRNQYISETIKTEAETLQIFLVVFSSFIFFRK